MPDRARPTLNPAFRNDYYRGDNRMFGLGSCGEVKYWHCTYLKEVA